MFTEFRQGSRPSGLELRSVLRNPEARPLTCEMADADSIGNKWVLNIFSGRERP